MSDEYGEDEQVAFSEGFDQGWELGYAASIEDDENIMEARVFLDEMIASLMQDGGRRFFHQLGFDSREDDMYFVRGMPSKEMLYSSRGRELRFDEHEARVVCMAAQKVQDMLGGRPKKAEPAVAPLPNKSLTFQHLLDNKVAMSAVSPKSMSFITTPFT